MPRIELISVPLFGPDDPYHYIYDNIPLKNLMRRQTLINAALDDVIDQTTDAIGTQGSFANRLNQSINPDGSLKTEAIDSTLHSIEEHEDTDDYVRMLRSESDKLELIADEATNFAVSVQTDDEGDEITEFDSGYMKLQPSSSITWEVTAPNIVKAHLGFPVEAAHLHHYDETPVVTEVSTEYYVNNTENPSFMEGSLRVYVNGVRLTASESIYAPGALADDPWLLLTYTPDAENGLFTLSAALDEDEIIRIDYDTAYVE